MQSFNKKKQFQINKLYFPLTYFFSSSFSSSCFEAMSQEFHGRCVLVTTDKAAINDVVVWLLHIHYIIAIRQKICYA